MPRLAFLSLFWCCLLAGAGWPYRALAGESADESIPEPARIEFFEKEIRPLLAEKCQKCHTGTEAKGGLRLTSREQLLAGGDSGGVVEGRDPAASRLIQAVRYDAELKMPPAGRLSATEIAALERWVRLDLPWPDSAADGPRTTADTAGSVTDEDRQFWSFQPLQRAVPPVVRDPDWNHTPIDRFIGGALEARGLTPGRAADRRTLLRRVTFDLTGLPPTPADMEAFLQDESPDAFSRVVDRLLASPHYGERWGRHWLDVVRYADSSGKDENIAFGNAFRYRDYVVGSFNRDLPFDRFLQQQLAGDLLPYSGDAERFENLVATGFLQLGPKSLAEQDKPKMLIDIADEQLDVVTRGFLGLSVSCARCHDHKFDPVPRRDYYGLLGIFLSTKVMQDLSFVSPWLERPLANGETLAHVAEHTRRLEEQRRRIVDLESAARRSLQQRWRVELPRALLVASPLAKRPQEETTSEVLAAAAQEANVSGALLTRCVERLRAPESAVPIILKVWNGVLAVPVGELPERAAGAVRLSVEGGSPAELAAFFREGLHEVRPASYAEFAELWDRLIARGEATPETIPEGAQATPEQLRHGVVHTELTAMLYGPQGVLVPPDMPRDLFLDTEREVLLTAERERDALQASAPASIPTTMAVEEAEVVECRIHIRGNHLNLGEPAPRGFLQVVSVAQPPVIPTNSSGRRELAEWITRPDHPLTPRVLANRIWLWHFGSGLVRTPDNLGLQGDRPVHGELLDWLARRLIDTGWSVKQLHREILLSKTWQLATEGNDELRAADPDNRLFGRFTQRRLEAEEIRDAVLLVSGQLDRQVGGNLFNYPNREAHVTHYKGPVNYDFPRRSIYLPVVRNALFDLFQLFDQGDALGVNGLRSQTVIAPQALLLLNSDFLLQGSDRLAAGILAHGGAAGDTERIHTLFQVCFGRPPRPSEQSRLLDRLAQLEDLHRESESDAGRRQRRVWMLLCQAILGTNEFVYVD